MEVRISLTELENLINCRFDELKSQLDQVSRQAPPADGLVDIEGAAAFLDISTRQVRNLEKKGEFLILKIGRSAKIERRELVAYVARLREKENAQKLKASKLTASSLNNRSGARNRKAG